MARPAQQLSVLRPVACIAILRSAYAVMYYRAFNHWATPLMLRLVSAVRQNVLVQITASNPVAAARHDHRLRAQTRTEELLIQPALIANVMARPAQQLSVLRPVACIAILRSAYAVMYYRAFNHWATPLMLRLVSAVRQSVLVQITASNPAAAARHDHRLRAQTRLD